MKKLLSVILITLLSLSLFGCSKKEEENTTISNPVHEVSTLEELNEKCGTNLVKPGVMGVTDEGYSYIDADGFMIAQYTFSVNGVDYCYRSSTDKSEEISGIYVDGAVLFEGEDEAKDLLVKKTDDGYAAKWTDSSAQYVLSAAGIEEDTFTAIAEEMKDITSPSVYRMIEGEYADEVSQRATATVIATEEGAEITVSWASSSEETKEWLMELTLEGDNRLVYHGGRISNINGENTEYETIDEEGYFTLEDGKLLWDGSNDENTSTCVFVKVQ